jgi:hypothetical protein
MIPDENIKLGTMYVTALVGHRLHRDENEGDLPVMHDAALPRYDT